MSTKPPVGEPQLFPYYKFTSCCDGTEIYFTGSLSITSGTPYKYLGVFPLAGTGGSLEPGYCYTVDFLTSQTAVLYPNGPSNLDLQSIDLCGDYNCLPCATTTCACPEGYTEVDGECVETIIINATYTGTTVQLNAGVNEQSYNKFGLRLYPDITSSTKPLVGSGNPYLVKANNGAGATITPLIAGVQSTLWGCETPTSCSTFTGGSNNYGGRLNIAGLWNTAYNATSGDGPELAFEYCIEVASTKQYLIGIAGDNKVKLYVDGVLNVYLNTGGSGGTAPFNWWHVFPVTLTAGTHTIRLGGINVGNTSGAFAGEIYDIDLATFQASLTFPAIGAGNCGNTIANLEPYILFSTQNMINQYVPNPNDPGDWTCPDGYELNECLGIPVCTIEDKFLLACPCYLLIPCDGTTAPFISNTVDLDNYINEFVSVSYGDFDGCVYVLEQEDTSCESAVDVIVDGDVICECDTICYYIEGADGITYVQYVDESDELLQIAPTATQPWLTLCSKVLPVVGNTTTNYTITALGECIDNECQQKCYKLIDCEDEENILYSTSFVLLPHALNSDIIKIAGYTECWIVELTEDDCDCAIDVSVVFNSRTCEECQEIIAYKLTSCNGSYNTQYTYDDLSQYVDQTLLTDCGCFIVELINYAPPSIQTIVIITAFEDCIACERPYYRLTECNTDETIDTYSDLSQYLDQVVNLANCDGCYIVESIIIPDNPSIVTVTDSYIDCITCATTAPCICSNVRNDNAIAYTYHYIDCYGDTQTVTVQPGKTSPKICLIKWLEPEGCDCLIKTVTTGSSVTNTVLNSSGTLINFKNSWELDGLLFIYYNGTQWIMNDSSENPQYYLAPSKSNCPSGTWKPFSSIPQQNPVTVTTVSCQSFYQYFGECNNGVCPAPVYPKRGIRPGYNTPACSAEKYEEISCKSSQILYRQVLELRYGISNCCPEEDEYWLVKKELIDIAALYNPDYVCAPANSCGCGQPNNCGCNSCNS
jgi:hypothetical protein